MKRVLVVDEDPQQGLILVQYLKDLMDVHLTRPIDVISHAERISPTIFVLRFPSFNLMKNLVNEIRMHPVFFNTGIICLHPQKAELVEEGADIAISVGELEELYWSVYSLKRRLLSDRKSDSIKIAGYNLNASTHEVSKGQVSQKIDPIQMAILVAFAEHPNQVLSREWFKQYVWQDDKISSRSVDAGISKVKKLLPELDKAIESIYGKGYIYRTKMDQVAS